MGVVGDKYVLTLTGYYVGDSEKSNPINNVFAYEATNGSPSAAGLWDAFEAHVIDYMLPVASFQLTYSDATVINLDNLSDFTNVTGINKSGEGLSDILPPFMAFEFEYVRAVRGVHNGRKSLAGLDEGMLVNGVPTAAVAGDLLILQEKFEDVIVESAFGADYTPKIWRRAGKYAPYAGDPPVGTDYPDTFYPIAGVVYRRVSTQNTRKR